jgi:hypothetical protein
MSSFNSGGIDKSSLLQLIAITVLAVLTHGYHLGADDSAIYIPAIKHAADPSLYPFGREFFLSHARLSIFAALIGGSARLSHLPIDFVIFAWHVASIFLLLLAAWKLLSCCFENSYARWSGVAFLAATLSVPVTGTGLAIMDPYLTARSLSTPATLFAIFCYLSNRPRWAGVWLAVTAALHPQMGVYGAFFIGSMKLVRHRRAAHPVAAPVLGMMVGLPFLFDFAPLRGAARECLLSRTFFFVQTWTWYQWIGVFAPLGLLAWFSAVNPRRTLPAFRGLAITLVPFGLVFTAIAVMIGIPGRLESYNRLQPMRSFHLVYVVFFALLGGLIGEYWIRKSAWRWLALLLPLALLMAQVQKCAFPASRHVEWPGLHDNNSWISAFIWIRSHTPKSAVFALDANYMTRPGEDEHGFRAVAERSALADYAKDSVVSLFPQLAPEWESQVAADRGLDQFQLRDFQGLTKRYPVTWIVRARPGPAGLVCPYENRDVVVCRM